MRGQLAQLGGSHRAGSLIAASIIHAARFGQRTTSSVSRARRRSSGQRDQPLLGTVVEVALEPAAFVDGDGDEPLARRAQLFLGELAAGDVAQVAGEHRLARHVDARDRELDGERAAVGAAGGRLDRRSSIRALAGRQVAAQAGPVRGTQLRRHDDVGHLLADRVDGGDAERPLSRGVPLGGSSRNRS